MKYMKFRFTFLLAFFLTAFTLQAQTVQTVATGLLLPGGLSIYGNELYTCDINQGRISKIDLSLPLPSPVITLLSSIAKVTDVLVVGDYLYFSANGANLPGFNSSVGRIDLTSPNPTVEEVTSNLNSNNGLVALLQDGDDLYISAAGASPLNGVFKVNITDPIPQVASPVISNIPAYGMALKGNDMYICDLAGTSIKKFDITEPNPTLTTVVSDLVSPYRLAVNGDDLYVSELFGNTIKKINVTESVPFAETVISGLSGPSCITFDGSYLYFGQGLTGTISRITIAPADECSTAKDINDLFGRDFNVAQTSALQNNTDYTNIGDPMASSGCYFQDDPFQNSLWYNFIGDGNTYRIRTVQCSATNYIPNGDTQAAIFTGGCGNLTQVACGDDEDINLSLLNFNIELPTISGETYWVLVDGYNSNQGEFCLEVTNLTSTSISFALGNICSNETSTLGGATPAGGVYSGPGVTDDGNGSTFYFDPTAAGGPGTYSITYTLPNGSSASTPLEVIAAPVIGVFGFETDVSVIPSLLPDPEAGPAGGIYAGIGVLPGNIFDAGLAGAGVHLLMYTFTDANGCTSTASGTITVNAPSNSGCGGASNINNLFGGPANIPQISSLYDNTSYNVTNDPGIGYECHYQGDALKNTIWYTFTGDGNTYIISSVQCNASVYNDDTQVAIYSGDCSNLTPVACHEDVDVPNAILNFRVEITTLPGINYQMLVDGFADKQGEFCLEVTRQAPNATTETNLTDIHVFPNPTKGIVNLINVDADQVQVFDNTGRMIMQVNQSIHLLDISTVPAGMYFLKIKEGQQVYSARVVKE